MRQRKVTVRDGEHRVEVSSPGEPLGLAYEGFVTVDIVANTLSLYLEWRMG